MFDEALCNTLYVFPGLFFIFFSHFCSFMVVWGLGLGSQIWLLGSGSQLKGSWACGVRSFGIFWVAALYKRIKISLGKKLCV